MGALIAFLLSNPTIIGIGAAIVGAIGLAFQQRMAGAKAERDKQAATETAAVNSAKAVQGQVDQLNPDDARKELGTWDHSKG